MKENDPSRNDMAFIPSNEYKHQIPPIKISQDSHVFFPSSSLLPHHTVWTSDSQRGVGGATTIYPKYIYIYIYKNLMWTSGDTLRADTLDHPPHHAKKKCKSNT